MFGLTVRDQMMITHSFNGDVFGSTQKRHGATYVVDVTFERHQLDKNDLIVEADLAAQLLREILGEFDMQNLDELPEFEGRNTTTEFMAGVVFERVANAVRQGRLGDGGKGLSSLRVTLSGSRVVWATYHAGI
ncbi:6-carboxytetrahydropterin synthase [Marinobacter nauticus]